MFALKYGEASFVAPFVFLTPVIAGFLIVVFFHEEKKYKFRWKETVFFNKNNEFTFSFVSST